METVGKKVFFLTGEALGSSQTFLMLMPDKTLYVVNSFLSRQVYKEDP